MDYSIFPKQDVLERLEAAKRAGGLCKEAANEIRKLRVKVERLQKQMTMRDLDAHPYSPDEQRVASWFFQKGMDGGDDPIRDILASHEFLAEERKRLRAEVERLQKQLHGAEDWARLWHDKEAEIERLRTALRKMTMRRGAVHLCEWKYDRSECAEIAHTTLEGKV